MNRLLSRTPYFRAFGITALAIVAAACGGSPAKVAPEAKRPQLTPEQIAQRYKTMMSRENGPFAKHELNLLGGLATASVEAATKPKAECAKDKDGDLGCTMALDLGKDQDGDPNNITCEATTYMVPFGPYLENVLGANALQELPRLDVKNEGEGIAVRFVADVSVDNSVGTAKVAALYGHGYFAGCYDVSPGGHKTFERITNDFFQSLKFKPPVQAPVIFTIGYQYREGDQTTGLRYDQIAKRPNDEVGFIETSLHFYLETDGKRWSVHDVWNSIERGENGAIESERKTHWFEGKSPLALTAKPTEDNDKKFRLKLEEGEKASSLETTPKAPLTTEFWSAPELLKVSNGTAPSYRYAFLESDDSDPAFHYITLTRSQPGVLLEDEEGPTTPKKIAGAAVEAKAKDELHVDARGIVTKEISSRMVSELIYNWGDFPAILSGKNTAAPKAPTAKTVKK